MSNLFLSELSSASCASNDLLVFCCHILMLGVGGCSFMVGYSMTVGCFPKLSLPLRPSRSSPAPRTSSLSWFVVPYLRRVHAVAAVGVVVRQPVLRWCLCLWSLTSPLCLGFWCFALAGEAGMPDVGVEEVAVGVAVGMVAKCPLSSLRFSPVFLGCFLLARCPECPVLAFDPTRCRSCALR